MQKAIFLKLKGSMEEWNKIGIYRSMFKEVGLDLLKNKGNVHPYHLVHSSPWPILTALAVMNMVLWLELYMHSKGFVGGCESVNVKYFSCLACSYSVLTAALFPIFFGIQWCRDVITEGLLEGAHTKYVQYGLRLGFLLFIVTEIMFFFAFFWAYFHSSFSSSVEVGGVWPPEGIPTFSPRGVPLVNTATLVVSGFFVTHAHHSVARGWREAGYYSLLMGILWGIIFEIRQIAEYEHASFSINDGIFGSSFYMLTGFHGFHVFLGLCGLIACLIRLGNYEFTKTHHVGLEAAAWYWHFVDAVWIIVFFAVYWWGHNF